MQQIALSLTIAIASVILGSWVAVNQFDSAGFADAPAHASVSVEGDRSTVAAETYYFTMVLPEHPKSFSQLSFTEQYRDPGANPVQFDFVSTEAFVGTPEDRGNRIATETWVDETGTFWVGLKPSAPPGTTLTIAFQVRNPPSGEFYEYGIAAYPATSSPVAVFVGNGTLTRQ